MKIKVGNTYYDPNKTPIMLIFEEGDRSLISAMPKDNDKIAFAPDAWGEKALRIWMDSTGIFCEDCQREIKQGETVTMKLDLALDADDGYGDYVEIRLCKECHEGGTK